MELDNLRGCVYLNIGLPRYYIAANWEKVQDRSQYHPIRHNSAFTLRSDARLIDFDDLLSADCFYFPENS